MAASDLSYTDIARQYARDIISGAIPATRALRNMCTRALRDLEQAPDDCVYWPERADHFCSFAERCRHVSGEWANRKETVKLEPFQVFRFCLLFGWYRKSGHRRYKEVFVFEARKNAKSTCAAIVALYCLALDGETGAGVYAAATTEAQAKLIFDIMSGMAKNSFGETEWRNKCHIAHIEHGHITASVRLRGRDMVIDDTLGKFSYLTGKGQTADGLNVHCAIIDEVHAHHSSAIYDVLQSGTGSRTRPIIYMTTTAGEDRPGSIGKRLYEKAVAVSNGDIIDDTFLPFVYQLEDPSEMDDETLFVKANPGIGVTQSLEYLREQVVKAGSDLQIGYNVRTKNFNVWSANVNAFLNPFKVDELPAPKDVELFTNAVIAIDYASTFDPTSIAVVCEDANGTHAHVHSYVTEDMLAKQKSDDWSMFATDPNFHVLNEVSIPYDTVANKVIELAKAARTKTVLFDPYQMRGLVPSLIRAGLEPVEYKQVARFLSNPTMEVKEQVESGKLHVSGFSIKQMLKSLHVKQLGALVHPTKSKSKGGKIDGAIALIMAKGQLISDREEREANAKKRADVQAAVRRSLNRGNDGGNVRLA
jgi:phage terminase large subunit-like protein